MLARTRPTNDEIRAAIDRVIGSEALRSSPQLIAFLRFVGRGDVAGELHLIKGYTIAIERAAPPAGHPCSVAPASPVCSPQARKYNSTMAGKPARAHLSFRGLCRTKLVSINQSAIQSSP